MRAVIGASACALLSAVALACGHADGSASALPLKLVRDVPLPGRAVRFDYQDVDLDARRLYIAHLGASEVEAVDLDRLAPTGVVDGVPDVHGVRVAPDRHQVFATATGADELVTIDTATLRIVSRAPTGRFPDGVAYDPGRHLVSVSNKDDGSETVVDPATNRVLRTVRLARETGNVVADPTTGTLLVAVRPPEELVAFDPSTGSVTARIGLSGCRGAHGAAVDAPARRAYVACEDNARLAVVDLAARHQLSLERVGSAPDVLALDPDLHRLYVAAESGVVTVFAADGGGVRTLGRGRLAD